MLQNFRPSKSNHVACVQKISEVSRNNCNVIGAVYIFIFNSFFIEVNIWKFFLKLRLAFL